MKKQPEPIPVYLICGFLESGKTSMIKNMLTDEYFNGGERTLVILCEEGEEEYDKETLRIGNAVIETVDEYDQLADHYFAKMDEKYHPERVIIEYNAIWTLEKLGSIKKPGHWELGQIVSLIDSRTFENYMTNMRTIMADFIRKSDLVIFNRCDENTTKSPYRRMIKALNAGTDVIFENLDGTSEDGVADEDLPYDVKADPIEISDKLFGIFYLDAMEHPNRYDGKKLHFKGVAFPVEDAPAGMYVFGRLAMTCCAADISPIGFLVKAAQKPPVQKWKDLVCTAQAAFSPLHDRDSLVMTEVTLVDTLPPKDEVVDFNIQTVQQ